MGKIKGIFDELREQNNGEELSDNLKDKFLDQINIEKNQEGYYLDAFGERISFNGIRQLKKPYTKLNLNQRQQNEIIACQEDYFYFRRNYCKILTKSGIGRPEPRQYQERLENELVEGDDVVAFFPRQCISSDTNIVINNNITTALDFFELCNLEDKYYTKPSKVDKKNYSGRNNKFKRDNENPTYNHQGKLSSITEQKFIKTIKARNKFVSTPKGNVKVLEVHKTIPYSKFRIETENGLFLEGAYNHVVIKEDYSEVYMKDSLNSTLITEKGPSKVSKVIDLEIEENMYDLSIDSEDELYFSNGILSHNSGKTVTIATYLLWCALTRQNINIGIAANVVSLAQEVLDKIKKIYIEMPIWLQPGLMSWNKQSVEFDNGNKIMISASNSDAFRGFSLSILYCSHEDEMVTVRDKETGNIEEISLKELNDKLKA
jgi:hypothetical protein